MKEFEGLIEKDFTVVLYADRKLNDQKKVEAWFSLNEEGTSCKCPPILFGEDTLKIPNDCELILKRINEINKV